MKNYVAVLTFGTFVLSATHARADQLTVLGTASTYGVLAASTITNSGATVVSGNLGLFNGTSVTGFLPGVVSNGTMHIDDGQSQTAFSDAQNAVASLSGLATTQTLSGQELAGLTLGSGVYFFSSSAALKWPFDARFPWPNRREHRVSRWDLLYYVHWVVDQCCESGSG